MALSGGGAVVPSNFTNHLETVWSPRFMLDTTEMLEIGSKFLSNSDVRIEKVGNSLVVRKIATKTVNKTSSTALDVTTLAYEADAETAVAFSPQFAYSAAAYGQDVQNRMLAWPEFDRGVREQFLRAIQEQIDIDCGALGDDLATTPVVTVNLDGPAVRQALANLRTNAKRYYKNNAFIVIHPSQMDDVLGIAEVANANLRGDATNPNVNGIEQSIPAWGATLSVSGNIVSSGGKRHNMVFIKEAFVLAYNQKPTLIPPQNLGLAVHLHAHAEYAAGELYDAYGIDLQSTT